MMSAIEHDELTLRRIAESVYSGPAGQRDIVRGLRDYHEHMASKSRPWTPVGDGLPDENITVELTIENKFKGRYFGLGQHLRYGSISEWRTDGGYKLDDEMTVVSWRVAADRAPDMVTLTPGGVV